MEITWSAFHDLNKENVERNVPEVAGVYLLWVKLKSEKWMCYYVGQAEDLQTRLLEHCSPAEQNDCIKNNVQNHISGYEYAKVAKQADRDGIEKFLYNHYKPECNKQDPGGTPIEVNLPP
jgi:excinuclease UvrABC nuclease subunit